LEWVHASAVEKLPFHHRDPFDRLLITQALAENIPLITADPIFRVYKVNVVW
jgi:PIN domain nuclease of toxin-antitoxin system